MEIATVKKINIQYLSFLNNNFKCFISQKKIHLIIPRNLQPMKIWHHQPLLFLAYNLLPPQNTQKLQLL